MFIANSPASKEPADGTANAVSDLFGSITVAIT
jgi:hypothetical protein